MTISTTDSRVDYTGNGTTTAFPVTFAFFDTDELTVIERTIATGAETTLTLSTHYTVSGGNGSTGTVTATTAPASTVQWTILRDTDRTQETAYPSNDPFPSSSHERALDRLTASLQEVERDNTRAVRVAATDATSGLVLPSSVERANKGLGFDANGLPVVYTISAGAITVTPYGASLVDDGSAAEARVTLGIENVWIDVASATTTDIGAAAGQNVRITGTTTITGLGTVAAGTVRRIRFAGALTLTHNATSLILPGGVSITTAANDRMEAVSLGSGNWIVTHYTPAIGPAGRIIHSAAFTAQSQVDIVLPTWARFFKLMGEVWFSNDTAQLVWRTSTTGAAPFDSGASDYAYQVSANSAAGTWAASGVTATGVVLTGGQDATASSASSTLDALIRPGDGTRFPRITNTNGGAFDAGAGAFQGVALVTGVRVSATRITAMRFLPSAGTFSGDLIAVAF